jgi:hypothetical protein
MKSLEILLRLIDNLLTAIKFRKAQDERNELEADPYDWYVDHFNGGLPDTTDKADKASIKD